MTEAALKRDVRVFTGVLLPENTGMHDLLRDLNLLERLRYEDSIEHVAIERVGHGEMGKES